MPKLSYATLEISLAGLGGSRYRVEARYWPVDSDALEPAATGEARLDPGDFLNLSPDAYGARLTERLFESEPVRQRFLLARQDTYARAPEPMGLRVRLWFEPAAEALFGLRWELLREPAQVGAPGSALPLAANDLIPFSRFLGSYARRPVRLRPQGELRVLVVIASPELEEEEDGTRALAVVDVAAEWARAKEALAGLPAPRLLAAHPAADGPPTRARLLEELAAGPDIVFIVCHGALTGDGPTLILETAQRQIDGVPGAALADALQGQAEPPRLIALASCQSAARGRATDSAAHLALGPALVRAGVPAVIAMGGKLTQATAAAFYPAFFRELMQHGPVDRAVCAARRTVRALDRPDWWMPVLYMRLTAGLIWSVMHVRDRDREPYEELSLSLANEECTPIVGPGLLEPLCGPASAIAREWAERRGYPLSPHRRDELPTVAQFLARRRGGTVNRKFVVASWLQSMQATLTQRHDDLAAALPGLADLKPAERLARLFAAAGARRRERPDDPYALLARLPVPIYLTATPDPLLAEALRAADPPREPVVDYVRWTHQLQQRRRPFSEEDRSLEFTVARPLVYHLFGTLEDTDSLVLTEDDFFDYLIAVVKDQRNAVVPGLVRAAWSANALMLLGFDLDDWTFRALYRVILQEEGHKLRRSSGPLSAAVQLNPEEDRNLRPDLALDHLEQVFASDQISLSWSQPAEFLREVWRRLPGNHAGGRP